MARRARGVRPGQILIAKRVWAHVRLAAIDAEEMRDLVEDAWALVVPKRVAEEYAASRGY